MEKFQHCLGCRTRSNYCKQNNQVYSDITKKKNSAVVYVMV